MAHVHVHITGEKPKPRLFKRTVRWADRAALGIVMGIAAFAVERAVLRASAHATETDVS